MVTVSTEERRNRLAARHCLAHQARDVGEVAAALVGIHSSDPTTVFLSCRARVAGFTVADLETALYDHRQLVRLLGMRRTLFVVDPDLGGVVDVACTQQYADSERRRLVRYLESQQVAADGERWLRDVEQRTLQALRDLGEATARELTVHVPELATKLTFGEGKTWGGQVGVSTRVLFLLATAGRIVRGRPRGTWLSSQYRWAPLAQWLGRSLDLPPRDDAQAELATRWLQTYGPGTLADLKWWTGWTVAATGKALERCGAIEVDLDGASGYVAAGDLDQMPQPDPWVALLPALDSTVMGWKERAWYIGEHAPQLFDRNGNAGPTVWAGGRVVGGWTQAKTGEIRLGLLESVSREERALIDQDAGVLRDWLGDHRITPRFRTPLERLLGD
jgi:hypothetical protein